MVSEIGTSSRRDGTRQVTYNGHPLYLFQGDRKPGDTTARASPPLAAAGSP